MKKYELTSETLDFDGRTLYRIRALEDIQSLGVEAGDLGGWVESEGNLTQTGECWIFNDAKVLESAVVCDSATIHDSTTVRGYAVVGGSARVSDYAEVSGCAIFSGFAEVFDYAKISGSARVKGFSIVYGFARINGSTVVCDSAVVRGYVSKNPLHLVGLQWPVTIEDTHMSIGCQYHSIEEWASFDDKTIRAMSGNALDFWNKYKEAILTLAKNHMKEDK